MTRKVNLLIIPRMRKEGRTSFYNEPEFRINIPPARIRSFVLAILLTISPFTSTELTINNPPYTREAVNKITDQEKKGKGSKRSPAPRTLYLDG